MQQHQIRRQTENLPGRIGKVRKTVRLIALLHKNRSKFFPHKYVIFCNHNLFHAIRLSAVVPLKLCLPEDLFVAHFHDGHNIS